MREITKTLILAGWLVFSISWTKTSPIFPYQGLVDVSELSEGRILVRLIYSTTNNFLGEDVYGDLEKAYLVLEAAQRLVAAQNLLEQKRPGYRIVVYDAARPLSVQRKMWEKVKNTPQSIYVASPERGSLHNYGVAVDVSLVDETGQELDMGTPVDFFGELASPKYEKRFLQDGRLSQTQLSNRLLLREIMIQAGFSPIETEWWHFQMYGREEARKRYPIIP
ncbi:M15 family metallopeptidase [Thermospira aquatica]|uniref:D-alanyl-D-alanine dipeptidase n=1 Tax=Thermospira aquatica TaxID=2828656 RepID=A0AAX3BB97_9SPIR|nr:M15 family metallopeptidase [Thermospira aquatica]URA09572.1 M15 family metallopeptidase [Thermospira aquatica]